MLNKTSLTQTARLPAVFRHERRIFTRAIVHAFPIVTVGFHINTWDDGLALTQSVDQGLPIAAWSVTLGLVWFLTHHVAPRCVETDQVPCIA
ncbi:hypothetical protein PoB_006652600 [Plakobranchus ocellatus]|uniref:Uncharacterized protein n=1 Tax=Plakobranchus ocellatus TaxID=259542 RepID=A0AAV4D7U7_9GAST|nr:hypothetical protein PoB_006652600 [Plakobranchus ocellatus]